MEVVRAKSDEAESLTALAHAAKRHWGYPEKWMDAWRGLLTITPESVARNVTYCAREDDRLVGFYLLTTETDGLHLDHLWVLPEAMGRGIGRELFGHAVEQARSLGHQTLQIEADPHAEGFYIHLGAQRAGINRTKIKNQLRELPLLQYDLTK
jgi:GNAT superfamily N-acetyltransferase